MSAQGVGIAWKRSADATRKLRMVGADHLNERDKEDFYPTPPELTRALLAVETFDGPIWECACGAGAISDVLTENGYTVESSDLVNRGYGSARVDFLMEHKARAPHIVTNPPYKLGEQFWRHACHLATGKVAFLVRITWLEGAARARLFREVPPSRVMICPWRPRMRRGALATNEDRGGGMFGFAWFIRDPAHQGPPTLGWLPDTRIAHVSGQDAPLFAGAAT